MMRFRTFFWLLTALLVVVITPAEGSTKRPKVQKLANLTYGPHKDQVLDVYTRDGNANSTVLVMVHGGAWRTGDKAARAVVSNKVRHWGAKGLIVVSVNYRLLPDTRPYDQATDVANAFAHVQQNATKWGGAPDKIILMGHSAGAHLVSLIASDSSLQSDHKLNPWLGTVAIDTAAFNVSKIMQADRVHWFYKKAFGRSEEYWTKTSPIHALTHKTPPFLAICSLQRKDEACDQAQQYIKKSSSLGTQSQLLEINMSHRELNNELGRDNDYTLAVDEFFKSIGAFNNN